MKTIAAAVTALTIAALAPDAAAEPVRILVAASSKQGLAAEHPLKFADNDATRVRDVMTSLGGVKPENAIYLAEPSRSALWAALDRAKVEAQKHKPDEVTLVFYFSGHGDREAIHLSGERVLLGEVTQKLAEVPASLRIAVTDACRSTRDKGFSSDEPFAISASVLPQASGQVWLNAASDGEAAQESDELQGAIFTNAWLSGLRGAADTNGDARVTLDESFAFANAQTLIRSSKSSGVVQKPEAVYNLREMAPVVITQVAPRMATLTLPAAKDTHFLVYSANTKSVVSEVWSTPERALLLSVPPGRYNVARRFGGTGGLATVAVAAGEERHLDDRDFAAGSLEALAVKGEDPDSVPPPPRPARSELSAGAVFGADTRAGIVRGARLGYAYAWSPRWAFTAGGELTTEDQSLRANRETLTTGFGRGGIEVRLPLGRVFLLHAGGGARAGLVAQHLTPHAGVSTAAQSKAAFLFGPELSAGLRALLGRSLFADLSATGAISLVSQEDAMKAISGVAGALALGARF